MRPERWSPKHVDFSMGKIDKLDDSVNQSITQGDQRIAAAQSKPVNQLLPKHNLPPLLTTFKHQYYIIKITWLVIKYAEGKQGDASFCFLLLELCGGIKNVPLLFITFMFSN
jgi:hypothetical protein